MSAHLCLMAWNEPIGPAELHAVLGVLHGGLEHLLGAADLLGGERHRGEVEHPLERAPAGALGADERGRRVGQLDLGLLAGLVHGGQVRAGDAGAVGVDREQRHAAVGLGGHDERGRPGRRRARTSWCR